MLPTREKIEIHDADLNNEDRAAVTKIVARAWQDKGIPYGETRDRHFVISCYLDYNPDGIYPDD